MLPDTSFLMGSFQGDLGRGKIASYQLRQLCRNPDPEVQGRRSDRRWWEQDRGVNILPLNILP